MNWDDISSPASSSSTVSQTPYDTFSSPVSAGTSSQTPYDTFSSPDSRPAVASTTPALDQLSRQITADRPAEQQTADAIAHGHIMQEESGKVWAPGPPDENGTQSWSQVQVRDPRKLSVEEKQAIISAHRQAMGLPSVESTASSPTSGEVRPDPGALGAGVDAAEAGMARFGTGIIGTVAPKTAASMEENQQEFYNPDDERHPTATLVGGIVGNTIPMIPAALTGTGAVATATDLSFGASTFGNVRADVAARRERGEQISGNEELAAAAAQAAIALGATKLRLGANQEMIDTAKKGVTQAVMAYMKNVGIQGGVAAAMQIANNAVEKAMIDPNTPLEQGVPTAALTGAAGAAVLGPVGELAQRQAGAAPAESAAPVHSEDLSTPKEQPQQQSPPTTPQTETPKPQAEAPDYTKLREQLSSERLARRTDELTGAPNRVAYEEDAKRVFADADQKSEHTAVVETDIGGLKVMNTVYGHEGGDEMLKLAHQAMREELRMPSQKNRAEDYLGSAAYRIGGDEFPAILRGVSKPEQAKAAMDRVQSNFDAKIAAKFPDLPAEARPFIAWNAEIRKPGDTRTVDQLRSAADAGVEPMKSQIKAQRNIPEGRTDLLNYIKNRQAEVPSPATETKPSVFKTLREKTASLATDESGAQHLSMQDITGPGSIVHEEVRPVLQKAAKAVGDLVQTFRNTFPVETGAGHKEAEGAVRSAFGKATLDQQKAEIRFNEARKGFDALDQNAQHEFQRRMDDHESQPTPELQKIADAMYEDTNQGRERIVALGKASAEDWHQEWWNRLWKKDPAKAADIRSQLFGPGKIEGRAGFLKSRSIENWSDALKLGLVPKFDNPVDMFLATRAERQRYIAGASAMKDLVDSGTIYRQTKGSSLPAGYAELDPRTKGPLGDLLKGDGPAIAPEGVANILKNVVTPSAIGSHGAFRLAMDVNNTLTQSLLGLSAFHVRKVAQELINMNVARGMPGEAITSPVKAIRNGSDIQKIMLGMKNASPQQARIVDAMLEGGMRAKGDAVYETQWKRKFQKALSDGGVQGLIRAVGYAPLAGNEHIMQNGIFQYVQHAKLHMGYEMARDALAKLDAKAGPAGVSRSEIRGEMGKISDHLDNVLGLMVRDNLFWNRTARDLATLSTLSVGWNYGSGRALAGGLVDLGKGTMHVAKGGSISDVDGRRVAYLASTAALTALTGAVSTYIATGHGPKSLMDYIYPDTGDKDRQGHAVRMNTGFYSSDWFDFMHDPVGTLKNKSSPLLHAASALLTNKDYAGTKIRNEDDKWHTQAGQVAKYLGETGMPLGLKQLRDTIQGGGSADKSLSMKLAPFAGFRTAKKSYSMSPAENLTHDLMAQHYEVGGRTQEQVDKSKLISTTAGDIKSHEPDAMANFRSELKSGQLTRADADKVRSKIGQPAGLVGLLKASSLTPDELMQVWSKADPDERKKISWVVRGRVARSESLDSATRRTYLKQIVGDLRGQ